MLKATNSAISEFAQIVSEYCNWAESPAGDPHEELTTARVLLSKLHQAVLALPEVETSDESHEDQLTGEAVGAIYGRFSHLPVNGYWDVFNPLEQEEPVFNTLPDDLSDIYRDLKEGLLLHNKGFVADAVWEWRFNFDIHWGAHLTGAQRAIHAYFS